MITVEDLLMAYASAYDAWLDPETERKNPTPEYAELIRQAVSFENANLRELVRQMHTCLTRPKAYTGASQPYLVATECPYFTQGVCDYNSCGFEQRMRELGVIE